MPHPDSPSRRRVVAGGAAALFLAAAPGLRAATRRPLRIFHVMSFDSPWRWTDGQLAGFRDGLQDVDVELRVFQMNVKKNSSVEAKQRVAGEARAIIDSWQPDLLYTSDDDALAYVAARYAGTSLPCVFSGANKTLAEHGIEGAANITGVLEREHFVESVALLRQIAPQVRRLAVISDTGLQWPPVIARIRDAMARIHGVELVAVDHCEDFASFQGRVLAYPGEADAMVQLGIFALRGESGQNVPYQQVQRWVCEHSRLPDISFWIDRIAFGVLASVTVSERVQGRAAGDLARRILVEGVAPAQLPVGPSVKGHPAINLTRAQQLGLAVSSSLLLSAEVIQGFQWQESG
ncbi:MAG: hypothetical protein KDH15_20445 [Rhodocyclaceae bacterium]|nr:hypothetical protein [Rhodocyclaceae bacterium]